MLLRLEIKRKLAQRLERAKYVDLHPIQPWILYFLSLFFLAMVSVDSEIVPGPCAKASADPRVVFNYCPYILIYEDGSVKRFRGEQFIPASLDPKTNVQSKDVVYAPETNLSARIFLPKDTTQEQKLPLLVYFHGGGFLFESSFSVDYNKYLNTLVAAANIIAVSVYYRRAPENPLPCAHDDSWKALKWIATHVNEIGPEDWLNRHADFQRVFIYGDSSGANQAHNMGMRNGLQKLEGVNVVGIILCMPFFWGNKLLEGEKNDLRSIAKTVELLQIVYPSARWYDIPLINPAVDPNLAQLGCSRVLNLVAGHDFLRHRGRYYYETLRESGWKGNVEIVDFLEEKHAFHLINPNSQNAKAMLKKIAFFINQDI